MNRTVKFPINPLLIIAITIFCAAYFFMAGPYWNITADSYSYVMGGKNLIERGHYWVDGKPHTIQPFMTSVLIGAIFLIFGESFLAINVFMKLLAVLCVIAAFFVLKQNRVPATTALIITLLTASNIHLVNEACRILSDIPFALFSFLSIWVFTRYIQNESSRTFLFAILLILISYFTRTMGIALIFAALTYLFIQIIKADKKERKKKKRLFLIALLCFVAPAFLWELRNTMSHGESFFYIKALQPRDSASYNGPHFMPLPMSYESELPE